jgi:hypothetical protein
VIKDIARRDAKRVPIRRLHILEVSARLVHKLKPHLVAVCAARELKDVTPVAQAKPVDRVRAILERAVGVCDVERVLEVLETGRVDRDIVARDDVRAALPAVAAAVLEVEPVDVRRGRAGDGRHWRRESGRRR